METIGDSGAGPVHYVRFQPRQWVSAGHFTGVFGLISTLAK